MQRAFFSPVTTCSGLFSIEMLHHSERYATWWQQCKPSLHMQVYAQNTGVKWSPISTLFEYNFLNTSTPLSTLNTLDVKCVQRCWSVINNSENGQKCGHLSRCFIDNMQPYQSNHQVILLGILKDTIKLIDFMLCNVMSLEHFILNTVKKLT